VSIASCGAELWRCPLNTWPHRRAGHIAHGIDVPVPARACHYLHRPRGICALGRVRPLRMKDLLHGLLARRRRWLGCCGAGRWQLVLPPHWDERSRRVLLAEHVAAVLAGQLLIDLCRRQRPHALDLGCRLERWLSVGVTACLLRSLQVEGSEQTLLRRRWRRAARRRLGLLPAHTPVERLTGVRVLS
jgi:hypothetical protein